MGGRTAKVPVKPDVLVTSSPVFKLGEEVTGLSDWRRSYGARS